MRWPMVGALAAACLLSAGVLVFGWITVSRVEHDPDWRKRDLLFLKSAHDRIQAELDRHSGDSVEASLRRGRQALLESIAEIAKPMPPDSIPPEVRPLLEPTKAPQPERLDALFAAVSDDRAAVFLSGLDLAQHAPPNFAELGLAADLRAPLRPAVPRPKPQAERAAAVEAAQR